MCWFRFIEMSKQNRLLLDSSNPEMQCVYILQDARHRNKHIDLRKYTSNHHALVHHRLPDFTGPTLSPLKPARVRRIVKQRLSHLIERSHHKRAVLHNRLVQHLARDNDEPRVPLAPLLILSNDRAPLQLKHNIMILRHGPLLRPKQRRALKRVQKRIEPLGNRLLDPPARLDRDIQQPDGRVRQVLDGINPVALARDDLHADLAVVRLGGGDLLGAQVAVPRLARLELAGEVHPQLQARVGAAVGVLRGHLAVHDPAAGRHELKVARVDGALVAREVLVVEGA